MVGLGRVELPTSPLSGVRSNQLSYRPVQFPRFELAAYFTRASGPLAMLGLTETGLSKLNSSTVQSPDCLAIQANDSTLMKRRV